MNDFSDQQLLRDYAARRSEPAFAELVRRHVDLVHSAALRMVRDAHLAEDVTQSAFVALAQNAASLTERPVLSGWLHRTAQNLAANAVRTEVRRRARETEAVAMNDIFSTEPDASWEHVAPHLDAALGELGEADRDALLLRYFERKSAGEMARTLGISDEAAQKRVNRAVEKLRAIFAKRKITFGAGGLAVVISANAVQAAPAGLAATISAAAALAGTAVHTTTLIAATKTIAMTTLQKTVITAALVAAAGAGIFEARQAAQLRAQNQTLQQAQAPLAEQNQQLQRERDAATNRLAGLLAENSRLKSNPNQNELLKLRGENTVLRNEAAKSDDPFVKQVLQWKANETKLRKLFADHPEKRVPELVLVSDDQWLGIAKYADLNSETGIRKAQSEVRHQAKNDFMPDLMSALNIFVNANDGVLPTDLNQLQQYFKQPVDEAILQQYKLTATGKYTSGFVVRDKSVIDPEYDEIWQVGPNGYGPDSSEQVDASLNTNMELLKSAIDSFMKANQGGTPATIGQLKSFITTPEQQKAFNQLIKARVGFGQPK